MTSAEPARSLLPGEQLYRLLADTLPDAALMLYDGDLRFLLVGGAALRDAGYDPDTMTGRLLHEVVAPESLPRLEPLYRAALAGEERDLAYTGPDGARQYEVRFRPVRDDAGAVVAGLVVTREVTERVRAAAALAESRDRWQRFFDQAPVGIWIAEPGPKGRVLEVNDALCTMLGRTREQVLASSKEELLGPLEDLERSAPLRPGVDRHVERLVVRPDGSEVVVSINGRVVQEPEGLRSLGHFVDVTDRHRVQEELQSALAFQDAVLSVIPDPVHVADAEVGTHVWTSRELGHDLGYDDAQLEAMDARGSAMVHPEDMALLADSVARVAQAADGELVHVRHRALAADGSQRWIDRRKTPFRRAADGTVEQYVSVTRDVTAEVEAEEALRSSLAFQQAVLTTSPDIVSVYDVVEDRTVWVSRSLGELLGYDLAQMQQLQTGGMGGLVHPDDPEEHLDFSRRCRDLADGEVLQTRPRVRHADGSWHVLSRRATPFRRDPDGRVREVQAIARDVTEQVARDRELEQVRAFQQAVIATTPDLVLLLDAATGAPVWSSRGLEELLGWTLEDLRGPAPFQPFVHPDDLEAFRDLEQQVRDAADGEVVQGRYRARHRDEEYRWLARRMTPFQRDQHGRVLQVLTIVRDVTESVESELALAHAALHDPLTGLPNRRLVVDRLEQATAETSRGGRVAVLFLDLDGFKAVNDAHGHAAGDAVLVETAARITAALRPGDTVGRMGGDEFVVLLRPGPDEPVEQLARRLAGRLRSSLAEPVEHLGQQHRVTASVGLAYATAGDDPDRVLRDADTAMYSAKTGGKDRIAEFDPDRLAERALAQD